MNKQLKGAFLVSLLANILLVGVLLGELPHRFERVSSYQERMEKTLKALPEPVQARFRDEMREDGEPMRDRIQAAREEAIRILVTEPFDESAYDRQVNEINELRVRRSKRMAGIVKEIAKDLPLEQRKVLAGMLRRPPTSTR